MEAEGWVEERAACPKGQALKWKQWSRTRVTKSQFSLAANWEPAVLMDGGWFSAATVAASSSRDQNQGKEADSKWLRFAIEPRSQEWWKLESGSEWLGTEFVFLSGLQIFLLAAHPFLCSSGSLASQSDWGHCAWLHSITPDTGQKGRLL